MNIFPKQKLVFVTAVYWLLLIYMIAALVWWFIALESQNKKMYRDQMQKLPVTEQNYQDFADRLEQATYRKSMQYIGEGITFLIVILVGAVFLYRSVRKELKLSAQQQDFMMAVTHELKTPVAAMQLNLQTIKKRKLEPDQQERMMDGVLRECNRLSMLTQNILLTSQLESGAYHLNWQKINLNVLILETLNEYRIRHPKRSLEIIAPDEDIFVAGESMLLQLVISNLLENAMKYSPADKTVTTVIQKEKKYALIHVKDEGTGLPEEEKTDIFKKFYRSQSHANLNVKGTGLGLYLCSKIMQDHKGTISLSENLPKGLVFTVKLPLSNENQL